MKFIVLLTIITTLQLHANVFSQTSNLTVKMENATFTEVVREIEKQSDVTFLYSDLKAKSIKGLELNFEKADLKDILEKCLEGTGLSFKLVDNTVVIVPSRETIASLQQKTRTINGQVRDEKGLPLPGVSVVVKGTSTGVATDIDGKYTLKVDDKAGVVLVFSFVGMKTKEVAVGKKDVLDVILSDDRESLEEVVVTGYQTISKERATGSFSVLDSENVSNSPNETIGDNLESLVAGVQAGQDENGNLKITIRGQSTLTGAVDPLIVVDGFAVEGGFETINRNDIDKITVLKDAAAASIWGARAANGVIVITTKKGVKKDGIAVSVEAYTKFSEEVDLAYANPIASSEAQLKYEKMLWEHGHMQPTMGDISNINSSTTLGKELLEKQYMAYMQGGAVGDPVYTLDTPELQKLMTQSYKDQVERYMLRKASSQNYNVSLRGQGEKNRYALSIMFNDSKQVMQADSDNNILINFKNNMKIKKWLDFDFAVMTQIKNAKSGGVGLSEIKKMSAYETLLDENGNYNGISQYAGYNKSVMDNALSKATGWSYDNMDYNPLQDMRSQKFKTKKLNTRINAALKFKISEGIRYNFSFQYERGNTDIKNRYTEESYKTRSTVNDFDIIPYGVFTGAEPYDIYNSENPYTITEHQIEKGEIVYFEKVKTSSYLFRNQFSFDRTYGDHGINFIAGTEVRWDQAERQYDWLYGYNHEKFTFSNPDSYMGLERAFYADGTTGNIKRENTIKYSTNKYFSLYANMGYTFKDKYTVSASVRTDASNITVKEAKYRYAPFWSVGGSWQITKEDFAKDYEWLDRLILRATYGVNGNVPYRSAQVPLISYAGAGGWGAGVPHATITDLGNPTLGWENVKQLNFALDFAIFGNKLFGSLEYYNKNSEDLVTTVSLPSTDGTTSQQFNVAAMTNKGFELNLNGNFIIANRVKWNPILNFAYNKNEVTSVNVVDITLLDLFSSQYVEGYAMYPLWYYKVNGLNEDGVATVIGENGTVYDANTNISNTGAYGPDIVWHKGSMIAPTVTSLTNEFSYKGFSLLTTITGKFGHYMRVGGFGYDTRMDGQNYHENLDAIIDGRADELGEFALPSERLASMTAYGTTANFLESRIEDASHIRFKEIMLSYTMPKSFVSKIGFAGAKVYAHVRNVGLLWTANDKDIDPDYPMGGSFFKPERTYTLGVNLKF